MFTTIGVCVIAHYCGGELEKVSLFSKPSSCCDGEEDESDDCCENDVKHVSFQKDFTFYQLVKECKTPVLQLLIFDFTFSVFNHKVADGAVSSLKSDLNPPNLVQQDIVSNTVIRI